MRTRSYYSKSIDKQVCLQEKLGFTVLQVQDCENNPGYTWLLWVTSWQLQQSALSRIIWVKSRGDGVVDEARRCVPHLAGLRATP